MIHYFSKLLNYIVGPQKDFLLEKRIFNIGSLTAILVSILGYIINLQLELPKILNIIIITVGAIFIFIYIKSRFFQVYHKWLFITTAIAVLAQSWITNAGVTGPINLLFILAIVVFLSITNSKYHFLLTSVILVIIIILHIVYFIFPSLILQYGSEKIKIIDLTYTFAYVLILMALLFHTYIKNYESERKKVVIQRNELEEKNRYITDSIFYANDIQQAILQDIQTIDRYFKEHLIVWYPKDIVSGDFYLFKNLPDNPHKKIAIIADCTGHGVPGAMLTMLGLSFLKDIITTTKNLTSDKVLNLLRKRIVKEITHQSNEFTPSDGIDAAVCIVDFMNHTLDFSGAHRPIYLIRKGKLIEYSANQMSVDTNYNSTTPFSSQIISLENNDLIYMFTDGYPDQFGEEINRKFYTKNLKKYLLKYSELPIKEQSKMLNLKFLEWKGVQEQIDDVLVFGFKYKLSDI